MDEKLERLGKERLEPAKPALNKQIQGEIAKLMETLTKAVKDGRVTGLAVAFVDDGEVTWTGWSASQGYFALAGATTFIGIELLEEYRKVWNAEREAANENQPAAASA